MDALVRAVFAVTTKTPADELEALVKRLENSKVVWGRAEQEAYDWAIEDRERLEEEGKQDTDEYDRLYWLLDTLGNIRYDYMKAHAEEIVADYLPSEFEVIYARLVFGDTDPGTLM